jgi:hypothetical protein
MIKIQRNIPIILYQKLKPQNTMPKKYSKIKMLF